MIRAADATDIDSLVRVEDRSFEVDRFSRRTFRYLLSKANAVTLVDAGLDAGVDGSVDGSDGVRGYAMVLFTRGTSLARLYSIAVDPEFRGRGVGETLLRASESAALDRDAVYMRLEVRADDPATQAFYRRRGYREFAVHDRYYEDDAAAIRMEKSLAPRPDPTLIRVPYFAQTLDFTCGPAALLMAMHSIDPAITLDQIAEVRIWRESTTVFMTSGLGGCSPEGLALAALRRGFQVQLYLSGNGVMFVESVRSETKKQVIRLVQQDFRAQLRETSACIVHRPLTLAEIREEFDAGGVPVVLVSSYRIDREKSPHWVVVTGFDHRYVYVHDPSPDEEEGKTILDCMQIPVLHRDFERMARYGRSQHRAVLIVRKGDG